ncbi:MAG: HDOD domain-containing protein [Candidatus Omnitrophota bacterium]
MSNEHNVLLDEWLKSESPGGTPTDMESLIDRVNRSEISTIRQSVTAIVRVINDPQSTIKELKEVILLDPPLAAKVLKTANSAYYSGPFSHTFTDMEQAIIWMGTETIKELALSQKVCEIFDRNDKIEAYSRKDLWRHSIAVGLMAKFIFRKEFGIKGENAYVAGLLHDIGIIAEDQFLQSEFRQMLCFSRSEEIDIVKAERETWKFDHASVGEAISVSWGLMDELIAAIGYHHDPFNANPLFSRIVETLYISDYYCRIEGYGYGVTPRSDQDLFCSCLRSLDIKPHAIEIIFKGAIDEIKKMEDKGLL